MPLDQYPDTPPHYEDQSPREFSGHFTWEDQLANRQFTFMVGGVIDNYGLNHVQAHLVDGLICFDEEGTDCLDVKQMSPKQKDDIVGEFISQISAGGPLSQEFEQWAQENASERDSSDSPFHNDDRWID